MAWLKFLSKSYAIDELLTEDKIEKIINNITILSAWFLEDGALAARLNYKIVVYIRCSLMKTES